MLIYGTINSSILNTVIFFLSYSGFQAGADVEYATRDFERLRVQDVGEGNVKIRCNF